MFQEWFESTDINSLDFSAPLFPKAMDRDFWSQRYDPFAIEVAELFVDFDWPVIKATDYMAYMREGDRLKQENPYNLRRKALIALTLGEVVEHKGRFIDDIINGVFAICEETYWGLSAHRPPVSEEQNIPSATLCYIDILASDTAELIATVYHMLYDELDKVCPEILVRMEYELERRIITPYLEHADFWWMGYNRIPNNWNPWIISNLLTVFLMVERRKSIFNTGLKKMCTEISIYYNVMPDDGGCDEGCGYWSLAGAKLVEFCQQLHTSTRGKVNFFEDEKLKNIARYIYRAYIGEGWYVDFADCAPILRDPNQCYILYTCGLYTGDKRFLTFAKSMSHLLDRDPDKVALYRIKRELGTLIYAKDIMNEQDFEPDDVCVLPDLQNCFIREGCWYYAAKGGHNAESHNHNDIGSFLVFYDNKPVLVDPGSGQYTKKTFSPQRYEIWTMQSGWHSLPVINGVEQKNGIEFRSDSFKVTDKVTDIGFASAYPEEAGIESVDRTIAFADDSLSIADRFVFLGEDNSVCEHFITSHEVAIDGDRVVIGGQFVLCADTECVISLDSIDFEGDPKLISNWSTDHMNRIKFTFGARKDKSVTFTIRRI